MGGLNKDKFFFDFGSPDSGDNVGSFLRAGTDGSLISSTLVSGKQGLDINLINTSVTVTATSLDIRHLVPSTDAVKIGDGTNFLSVNADGSLNVDVAGNVADNVADTGNPLKVGSRAVSGALAAIGASNDRADVISDMYRRVFVNDSPGISTLATAVNVGNVTPVALPASALPGRRRILIQNNSANTIYVGHSTVTSSSGTIMLKGTSLSLDIGQFSLIYAIAGAMATNDVRVLEQA